MVLEFSTKQRTVNYITGEKTCSTCVGYKPLDRFNKSFKHGKWVYRPQCKDCESVRLKENSSKKIQWFEQQIEGLSCMCGNDDIRVLDLHHTDPTKKDFNIARLLGQGYSIEHLKKEFPKCVVICSNCHRILHSEEKKDWRWYAHQRRTARKQQALPTQSTYNPLMTIFGSAFILMVSFIAMVIHWAA